MAIGPIIRGIYQETAVPADRTEDYRLHVGIEPDLPLGNARLVNLQPPRPGARIERLQILIARRDDPLKGATPSRRRFVRPGSGLDLEIPRIHSQPVIGVKSKN